MGRPRAEHGTYAAYRRHLADKTAVCAPCRDASRAKNRERSNSAAARAARASTSPKREKADSESVAPSAPVQPAAVDEAGHISRLEVLKEMLQTSRETIAVLKGSDSSRLYLLMREQREIVREISEIQGNGQVKGVTLADQLADARAARAARAAGA